jgi:hypothetical protein
MRFSRRRTRPRWSLKESFWAMVVIVLFDFVLVCGILHRPLWQEMELASVLIGVFVGAVLTWVLYVGVRLDDDRRWTYGSSTAR